ncbi:glycosidase [Arthrobacter cheniae]|uniref:Glycosidase n=1 Tax=Arthrobacter cheniae TaxID=1258888 RepID=A0A3A5LZF9_9MICC|nr:glycosidase [Arthrobacter cheniae]RJT78056.1 glycosidase [Arthrobacter cheniae]
MKPTKETVITARNRTNVRLRTTLALLADHQESGTAVAPGELMSQAVAEVPFDDKEAELLAGGVPRGYKALTTATSRLVKAGWLLKSRNGWAATEEGVRAVRAFTDPDQFVNAMISGAPVPDQPVEAPAHAPLAPEQLGEEAQAIPAEDPTPPDVTPTLEVTSETDAASDETPDEMSLGATDGTPDAASDDTTDAAATADAWHDQPQSVALSGDFDPLFGEAGHWSTDLRELQLSYDAGDNSWKQTLQMPAGTYQFKILVNNSWDENYGRYGVRDGANHELHLLLDTAVTVRFDYATKDITTS